MAGVFSNIKIAAFTWAIVGPLVVKYLADQGATVIRLETASRPCAMRTTPPFKDGQRGIDRSGYFAHTNSNQYSMSVNLSHPLAKRVVDRLVSEVDIVVESAGDLIPIEVKATSTPRPGMAAGIEVFRKTFADRAKAGYVIHTGDIRLPLAPGVKAVPFAEL